MAVSHELGEIGDKMTQQRKKMSTQSMWIMDKGCSKYMTNLKEILADYEEKAGRSVTFGDNSLGHTKGVGTLETEFVKIKNVSYVDGLKHNLLLISQLGQIGGYRQDL